MLKKTIKYTDYNGVEKEEDFYFNLTKTELTKMEVNQDGGMQAFLKRIIDSKDAKSIMKLMEELILMSYGIKRPDGSFDKSEEISRNFSHTVAYDQLFMELVTNTESAAAFANGIIPADLMAKAKELENKKN